MLQSLHIKNFAIIEDLSVDFSKGMTVLTGETGAGKSIIIDAVSLIAGSRSSTDFIRYGCDKAIIQAVFYIENHQILAQLQALAIDIEENTLIIYREIQQSKKNIIRINGVVVTLSQLKEIMRLIIDIHGQHEHQFLMDETRHLELLDNFANEKIASIKNEYTNAYQKYKIVRQQLKKMLKQDEVDHAKLNLLKRQIAEIQEVNPQPNEDIILEAELKKLLANQKSGESLDRLNRLFSDEEISINEFVKNSIYAIQDIADLSLNFENIQEQLVDIQDKVYEVSRLISYELDKVDFDPERLDVVEERLNALEKLKFNYGETIDDILNYYSQITKELDAIENKDMHLNQLQKEFIFHRDNVLSLGKNLSNKRQEFALLLEKEIKTQLADLYMDKVQFKVAFKKQEKVHITADGIDQVEFLIATNIGEPLKPLIKISSGGELSRMMLALKTIFTKNQHISTIIFDEIDTGVSGRVAQAIANKMSLIGQYIQVLCISHLPQVAAKANYHLFVNKEISNNRTYTSITQLGYQDRQYEIAKMIAGENVTTIALNHAKELLEDV